MQDVDFEMKYEPGRDELDPLDLILIKTPITSHRKRQHRKRIESSDYDRTCSHTGQD